MQNSPTVQDEELLLQEIQLDAIIRRFGIEPILGVGECSFEAFHAYYDALSPEDKKLDVDSMLCDFNRDLMVYAQRHSDPI